jgi:CubicO group peptidase (beta-lactamase class C family)
MKVPGNLTWALRFAVVLGLASSILLLVTRLRAAEATYTGLQPDTFLKQWLVLGPIPVAGDKSPDDAVQQQAFAQDWLISARGESGVEPKVGDKVSVAGKELEWRRIQSASDVVDLNAGGPAKDFCIAYAWAEIEMPSAARELLGIGSDDAVKVWLNGKLIHENWTGRPARPDDDLVWAEFHHGRNHLLLKIQNQQADWGFACRLLGSATQGTRLYDAAARGDVDALKLLLERGVNVNRRGALGLTAYQSARLHGRKEAADYLQGKGADTTVPLPAPERLVEILFQTAFKPDGPGAAVLVAKDGQILLEHSYGLADIGNRVPVTPETKFRIGSITKQFTAAAILKLYEEGKLSLQDPLSKFVPDFPRGPEVTIHHLLTHTSGIHSYTSKPDFIGSATVGTKWEDHIKTFQNDPYDFDPGQKWLYNNSGFFLLGYIVEKVSRQSYADYLRSTFFEPLGMKDTGVHEVSAVLQHEATGYSFENGKVSKALNWDMSKAGGAGALYSTVRDLYRWNEAVFNGKVLKDSTLKAAFTPVKTASDDPSQPKSTGYGYGWGIDSLRGALEIGHGGGLNGFLSYLLRLPQQNFTVTVLANSAPPLRHGDPGSLAHEIVEFYLGETLPPRESPKIDRSLTAKDIESIAGRYDYGMAILVVTLEQGKLFAQLGNQPKFEIFPRSSTNFFWKAVEADVTFMKDEDGQVTRAIHHQGGATITAPRLPEIKEAAVDPMIFDRYAGRYDCGGGKSILTVTREGDRLFAELTGNPKVEIFPKSETDYFCKLVNAEVSFAKDPAGKTTKAIIKMGGQTTEAPRME